MSGRKKILVADDSGTARMMQQMILKSYDVVLAKDGREAVDRAASERPDLILMDYVMPHMNGIEACETIRARPDTREIPIIMVTTKGEEHTVEEAFRRGCSDYVTKPVSPVELLAKVRNYLGE